MNLALPFLNTGPCSIEGCMTSAAARGLCNKHGARGTCSIVGCKTAAKSRGFCGTHGPKKICTVTGCNVPVKYAFLLPPTNHFVVQSLSKIRRYCWASHARVPQQYWLRRGSLSIHFFIC